MRKRAIIFASAAAITLLGLTACSGGSSDSVVGVWGQPDVQGQPSINFADDGSYSGSDGCNNIMGSWEADGNTIDLGMMATTMMACQGVDEWLSKSSTAVRDGNTLTFFDANDSELGTLDRS